MQYRVLVPFQWFRSGQVISSEKLRHIDARYLLKKHMIEEYTVERAVAPAAEVETAVAPKRRKKQT